MFKMNFYSVVFVISNVIFIPICNSGPIQAPSVINIVTENDNYEINKYNLLNGVNFVVQRLSNAGPKGVRYSVNIHHTVDTEFRFNKTEYEVNTNPTVIGIIGCFTVQTTAAGCIVYGLASDDVYINKVFRVGPDSGLLYADSPINAGVYKFNVTADITDQQLHAVAKVIVNVKTKKRSDLNLEISDFKFKLAGVRTDADNNVALDKQEKPNDVWKEGGGDVDTNEIVEPSHHQLWSKILRDGFSSGLSYADVKKLVEKSQTPFEKEGDSLFLPISPIDLRRKRAVPPSDAPSRPSVIHAVSASTVQSKRIYQESPIADTMMSAFVIFVVSFGTLFFFGSIFYFAYKRLKKCGDYAVDEDVKSTTKPSDDETVYSTVQSDLKNPNILSIPDLKQNRVVDSIEITKQKLSSSQTNEECNGDAIKETSFNATSESPPSLPPDIPVEDLSTTVSKSETKLDIPEVNETQPSLKEEKLSEESNENKSSQNG